MFAFLTERLLVKAFAPERYFISSSYSISLVRKHNGRLNMYSRSHSLFLMELGLGSPDLCSNRKGTTSSLSMFPSLTPSPKLEIELRTLGGSKYHYYLCVLCFICHCLFPLWYRLVIFSHCAQYTNTSSSRRAWASLLVGKCPSPMIPDHILQTIVIQVP